MNNSKVVQFIAGLALAFSIEILVMSIAVAVSGASSIPVFLIFEAFGLAISCSIMGAVFSSDKLTFLTQGILTFIFSYSAVILFSFMFHWYELSDGYLSGKRYFIVLTILFTVFYSLTMTLRGIYLYRTKKKLNEKLIEYKRKANSEEDIV
jgi:hypothetical protein